MGVVGGQKVCILCHHRYTPLPPDQETGFPCFSNERMVGPNGERDYCPRCLCLRKPVIKWEDGDKFVRWYACPTCMKRLVNYPEWADLAWTD